MTGAYTVSLDRRTTTGATSDMGWAVEQEVSESGFPVDVRCDWQPRNGRAVKTPQGLEESLDAMMLCDNFHTGRVGDVVTDPHDSSVKLRVFSVNHHSRLGSATIDHTAYWLTRALKAP